MAVAGLLAQYMAVKNQLSYDQLQLIRWQDLAEGMSKKLSQQTGYQEKWDGSSEAFEGSWGESKEFKADGTTFQYSNGSVNAAYRGKKQLACSLYADKKVPKFDKDKLDEYTDLDMEYDTMVSMYETLCTELEGQADALKEQTGSEAQDTHMISGG